VALVAGRPVGSVTLVAHDMATCRDLTPWLAGLYVVPDHRGHGTGGMLVRHAEARAHAMGVQWLYLYSTTAVGLYRRLGWRAIFQQFYAGALVTVMGKDLTACGPSALPDSNA
jgi:GNAT superfamily N-acetyltransferase